MIFATPNRGTGGAGAKGILQGMMAGQQSREADKRMDFLQVQQERQTEQYEGNENNERLYNMRQVQKEGGNIAPLLTKYNKWRKDTTNFSDGDDFRMGNWDEYRNDEGNVNQAAKNQWRGDTGFEYDENTEKQSPIMLGDKFFNFDTFSAGAPKFKSYADDRDMANKLKDAQIAKIQGEDGGPTYAELKVLKDKGMLPKSMDPLYNQLEEKVKLRKGNAQDELSARPFEDAISAVKDGGTLGGDYKKALKLEQQADGKYKNPTLDSEITSYRDMMQVKADVAKLVESGVNTGVAKKYASEAAKYAKDYDGMSQPERQKQLNTIVMNTKIGGMLTRYLKAMSGTAVTEDEFNRQLDNLVGGDINKINAETVMAAMQATTDDVGKSVGSSIEAIEPMHPASKMWRMDRMNKARNVTPADLPDAGGPDGTKTVEEAGLEGISDEAAAGLEYGGQAAQTLIEKIMGGGKTTPEEEAAIARLPWLKRMLVKVGWRNPPKLDANKPKGVTDNPEQQAILEITRKKGGDFIKALSKMTQAEAQKFWTDNNGMLDDEQKKAITTYDFKD